MDEVRLAQILAERDQNPEAFRRDGHAYFLEALPLIQDMVAIRKVKAKADSLLPEASKIHAAVHAKPVTSSKPPLKKK